MQQRAFRSRAFNRSTNPILPVLDRFDLNAKSRRRGGLTFGRILFFVLGVVLLLGILAVSLVGVPALGISSPFRKSAVARGEDSEHGGIADHHRLRERKRPHGQWQRDRERKREAAAQHLQDASEHVAAGGHYPPFGHGGHHDEHFGHEEAHGDSGHEHDSHDGSAHVTDPHAHETHDFGEHGGDHQLHDNVHLQHYEHDPHYQYPPTTGHHEEAHMAHHDPHHDQQEADMAVAEEHRLIEARLLAEVTKAQKLVTTEAPKEQHTAAPIASAPELPPATGIYAMSVKDKDGHEVSLAKYMGKVTIVVNLASKCGYTKSNYEGLTELYNTYKAKGVEVIGFPCNQFGGQEPGTCSEVQHFAAENYQAHFPIYDKVDVNGPDTHPVYQYLKQHTPEGHGGGGDLEWNFAKWIVDKKGHPVVRYGSDFDRAPIVGWLDYELSRN